MAPAARKRKSDEIEEMSRPTTPTGSPVTHKKLKVSEAQKQALMDNLQLEIDERKRRLRVHYALQSADLRSRIERRINRIPMAMRRMTMREVMAKHQEAIKAQTAAKKPVLAPAPSARPLPQLPSEPAKSSLPKRAQVHSPAAARGRKRKTSEIHIASDQDSENQPELDSLPVAKKARGKAAVAPASAATRAASRTQKAPSVLSPRSHNSQTLARSPTKDWKGAVNMHPSPIRSAIARPISPIKPASPLKSAAFALSAAAHGMARGAAATASKLGRTASKEKTAGPTATAATTAKGKMLPPPRPVAGGFARPASPMRQPSTYTTTSEMSMVSSGTTVVNKPRRGRAAKAPEEKKANPAPKRTATGASSSKTAVKGSAADGNKKSVVVAEPAAGRRVLRKRN
ncbi:hypothetical protein DV735_g2508, partial [Chaetothyriales sp. CBS 134920]